MGLGIEIPVEIFIDQRGFSLSDHRCTIAAMHRQMTLRRHVTREYDTKRLELREAIGDGQCRWFVIVLACWRSGRSRAGFWS